MSNSSQVSRGGIDVDGFLSEEFIDSVPGSLVVSIVYPRGWRVPWHVHGKVQVFRATSDGVRIHFGNRVRELSPRQCFSLPAGVEHRIDVNRTTTLQMAYLPRRSDAPHESSGPAPGAPGTDPSMFALFVGRIVDVVAEGVGEPRALANLCSMLDAQLDAKPVHDPRLRSVIDALGRDWSRRRTMEGYGRIAGASKRTLSRLVREQTGMSFHAWQQGMRLDEAKARLAEGRLVTEVAMELGYSSCSAFTAAFKKTVGVPPKAFSQKRSRRAGPAGAGERNG